MNPRFADPRADMAKKDTYLALLRRGIDETTANQLADAGIKIGDLKRIDASTLVENYGLTSEIADGVIEIIRSGPGSHGRERFLTKVLAGEKAEPQETKIDEMRFQRQQRDILVEQAEARERLKTLKVEAFKAQKIVMNRLGKTIELIVKLENTHDEETREDQRTKIRDQLETRGLEAARDHEMLELEGIPQNIVDFRRKIVPELIFHRCKECEEEMDPRQSRNPDDDENWSLICWECETTYTSGLGDLVDARFRNGGRITIDPDLGPRNPVPHRPASRRMSVNYIILADLERTGATVEQISAENEARGTSGALMSIDDWIDQTLALKGYIQAQEDREDFILRTGAGATKFNKWMKKAGLVFNKQTGRWSKYEGS